MNVASITAAKRRALAEAVDAEISRQSLLDFAERMIPGYLTPPHIRLIAEHLEKLEGREIRRLRISCPPRAGKTLLASKLFVSWYMGRHPTHEVACCSYNEDTASVTTRQVRDYIGDDRYPFATRIRSDSSAAYRMNTTGGGAILAAGITSSLTGRGAHVLVLDDMAKDYASAVSETVTESVIAWYQTVASTRLYPDSIVLAIGTRWSERDLQQHIIDNDNGEWVHLTLPAIAEDDDPLGRAPGEVLWPERFPAEFIAKQRATLGEAHFGALYQAAPIPRGGNLFKADWFAKRYTEADLPQPAPVVPWQAGVWNTPVVHQPLVKVMALDSSWGARDYSVFIVAGTDGQRVFILDMWRGRVELPELERALLSMYTKHRPDGVVIEDASAGSALIQTLRRTLLPIFASKPQGSNKELRWSAAALWCESGRVLLPQSAQWLPDFFREVLAVPAARHDDVADAFALAVNTIVRFSATRAQDDELARALSTLSLTP
jgi:predicted phage terminase large subunit-like protein